MNPLYSIPLHGISCAPYCGQNSTVPSLKVNLDFSHINTDSLEDPVWELNDEGERYLSKISLFKQELQQNNKKHNSSRLKPNFLLKVDCQGRGVFDISENSIIIDWQDGGTDSAHYFQTLGAALYLELKNVLCIHANALAYKNKAIAIVAPSQTGKTTLTATLSQNGFALMTDDMIALHQIDYDYVIYPSWPIVRMWPDALEEILGATNEQSKKVHEKFSKRLVQVDKSNIFSFCNEPKKLQTIYLLNRIGINLHTDKNSQNTVNRCEISEITSAEAVIILLQNSILGSAYKALNLESIRLLALSTLLTKIRFKKITYSSGKNNLINVCEHIKKDLNN